MAIFTQRNVFSYDRKNCMQEAVVQFIAKIPYIHMYCLFSNYSHHRSSDIPKICL